jgi:multisubunit Na+/H+ antiporter MnhB subunit
MDAADIASTTGTVVIACGLAIAGLFAFGIAAAPRGVKRALPPVAAFAAGVVFFALAADVSTQAHQRFGEWLSSDHGIDAPWRFEQVEDAIVMGYVAVGALAMVALLPFLIRSPRFFGSLSFALALLAGAAATNAFADVRYVTPIATQALAAAGAIELALAFSREASRDAHLLKLPHERLHGSAWRETYRARRA